MSEVFKEVLVKLLAYGIPFKFMSGMFHQNNWAYGYTVEDGKEHRIWEVDDMPNKENIIFFRTPESIEDVGIMDLSSTTIMFHILAREKDVNGVDYK